MKNIIGVLVALLITFIVGYGTKDLVELFREEKEKKIRFIARGETITYYYQYVIDRIDKLERDTSRLMTKEEVRKNEEVE